MTVSGPLLDVHGLSVSFRTPHGEVRAVNDVSFTLERGESLVIVGESGSGKTVLAHAILRLLPRNVNISGSVRLSGREILQLGEREMRGVRGREIALIPQSPGAALNPVRKLGPLLREIAAARGLERSTLEAALAEVLKEMSLDLETLSEMYPHQLSGGMQQRVVNALALVGRPDLVIADEPTHGLDSDLVDVTADQLRRVLERGSSLLVITHDLVLAERLDGRITLLYAGRAVEQRRTTAFFQQPRHPYGEGLLAARPERGGVPIPGLPPELTNLPPGCAFAPRCSHAVAACSMRAPDDAPLLDGSGTVRCVLYATSGEDRSALSAQGRLDHGVGRALDIAGAGSASGSAGPERLR